jgi:hypothetical protein
LAGEIKTDLARQAVENKWNGVFDKARNWWTNTDDQNSDSRVKSSVIWHHFIS